jgi:hypothetical protein
MTPRQHPPETAASFYELPAAIGTDRESALLNKAYQVPPHANFSSMIPTHCPEPLLVVPIGASRDLSLSATPLRATEREVERAGVGLTLSRSAAWQ